MTGFVIGEWVAHLNYIRRTEKIKQSGTSGSSIQRDLPSDSDLTYSYANYLDHNARFGMDQLALTMDVRAHWKRKIPENVEITSPVPGPALLAPACGRARPAPLIIRPSNYRLLVVTRLRNLAG